jgi:hypothetical protein
MVKRVINEGTLEDITSTIDKTISNKSTLVSDLWDITSIGNNTISISPVGQNKPTKIKLDFPGKSSFKLQSVKKSLGFFTFQVSLKNKDFPLTWGLFKSLPGSGDDSGIKGYVYDQKNKKWVKQRDVETTMLGKIDYEHYGYVNSDDVILQFNGVGRDEMLRKILSKLKTSKMQPFQEGIKALGLSLNLTPL